MTTDILDQLYRYRANITKVYDGDSVTADIDLGLGTWVTKQKLRLFGIDTPELRGDEEEKVKGRAARDWLKARLLYKGLEELEDLVQISAAVVIETHRDKTGKYGRWLCTIWHPNLMGEWINLNQELINTGHAVEYLP